MLGLADVKIIINKDMTKQELRDLVDSTDARRLTRLLEKGNEFDDAVTKLKNQLSEEKDNTNRTAIRERKEKFQTRFFSILATTTALHSC